MYDFYNDPAVNAAKAATATTTTTAPKANFWDTLFKAADSTAKVITAVKQQPAVQQPGQVYYQQQPLPPQSDNTMRNVLIVGGIALAAGAAWAIFGSGKKK